MIAIEVKQAKAGEDPTQVVMTLDREGLQILVWQLKFLTDGRTDHLDLMSESWGGTFLEDAPRASPNNHPIHYMKVMLKEPWESSSPHVEAAEDEWVHDPGRTLNDALLERLRRTIEDVSPVIVEHRFYRGGSAPHRFVCDSFDQLAAYVRRRTHPGDSFHFWQYEHRCSDDSVLAHGKVPNEEGKVPKRGAY